MAKNTVNCMVLKEQAEALETQPYPGELGQRILENVSQQGWARWLERLVIIVNENGLNTSDPKALTLIEKHMNGFFFDEGDHGQMPAGFHAAGEGGAPPSKK